MAITSFAIVILQSIFIPFVAQGEPGLRVGVAMPDTNSRCEDVQYLDAAWSMDYTARGPMCFDRENVRMVWGPKQLADLPQDVTGVVLEMNEPNYKLPCGWPLTPEEGAALVRAIEAKAPRAFLVSPAMAHTDLEWLTQMRDAYIAAYGEPPRWDALAMHCYQDWSDCRAMTRWYEKRAREWGIGELWLTEYASSDLDAASDFIGWLRERDDPPTTHLAWFTNRQAGEEWAAGFPNYALLQYDGPPTPTRYGAWFKEQIAWRQ